MDSRCRVCGARNAYVGSHFRLHGGDESARRGELPPSGDPGSKFAQVLCVSRPTVAGDLDGSTACVDGFADGALGVILGLRSRQADLDAVE
jgi:hypothetical protein